MKYVKVNSGDTMIFRLMQVHLLQGRQPFKLANYELQTLT